MSRPDDRPLVQRVQTIRQSLRGESRSSVEESPVEEYERKQFEKGYDATERLIFCEYGWLAAQGLTLAALLAGRGWPGGEPRWVSLAPIVPWLASIGIAMATSAIVFRHRDALPVKWIAAGVLPWAVLVLEATAVLIFVQ